MPRDKGVLMRRKKRITWVNTNNYAIYQPQYLLTLIIMLLFYRDKDKVVITIEELKD